MARPKARAVVCEGRRRPRVQMRLVWKLSVPECSSHTPKPGKVPKQCMPKPHTWTHHSPAAIDKDVGGQERQIGLHVSDRPGR